MEKLSNLGPPPSVATVRLTSPEERMRRMAAVRDEMRKEDVDVLIVTGRDDIRYRGRTFWLSDYWQLLADTHVVILPEGNPIWVGGQIFGPDQAMLTDWADEFRMNGKPGTEIANLLKEKGCADGTIGIVGMSDASLAYQHFMELKEGLPDATLRDATDLFETARHFNSEEELDNFRATSQIFRNIYAEIEPKIRPGMTEIELAAICHHVSREGGLRDPMILISSAPLDYGALSFGTTKTIGKDEVVTIWIESAGPSGFWLEYRRCYSFGTPEPEYQRYWGIQKECLAAGLSFMKPGVRAREFVSGVQEALKEYGYHLGYHDPTDTCHVYSLHGIKTDAIQGVWVPGNDRVLIENEVVNIHPAVHVDDAGFVGDDIKFHWLGVTDNAIVTPSGGELMTHDPDLPHGFIEL